MDIYYLFEFSGFYNFVNYHYLIGNRQLIDTFDHLGYIAKYNWKHEWYYFYE